MNNSINKFLLGAYNAQNVCNELGIECTDNIATELHMMNTAIKNIKKYNPMISDDEYTTEKDSIIASTINAITHE